VTVLDAIIQGIVQGLTEFLPISKSGHLLLIKHFLGISGEEYLLFSLLLQLGTLLSILLVFRKTIFTMLKELLLLLKDLFTGKFSFKRMNDSRRMLLMFLLSIIPLILFYSIKNLFVFITEGSDIIVEGALFMVAGFMIYLADRKYPGDREADVMHGGDALLTGVAQGLSILPPFPRTGMSISTLILLGFTKSFAVEFAILVDIPAIIGFNIGGVGEALTQETDISGLTMLAGFATAVVVGIVAIKFIQWIVKADHLNLFAYYTIFIGCVVIIVGLIENVLGRTIYDIIGTVLETFNL